MVAAPAATACQVSAGLSTSVALRSPVGDRRAGVPLLTPPASITLPDVVPLITAASLAPLMVMVTSWAVPSTVSDREAVGQCGGAVERLHRRIVVVERVGPDPGRSTARRCRSRGAAPAVRPPCQAVGRIVDVGGVEIAGRDRRARRAVGDPAGLDHRPGDVAADHRRIVGAIDGDGHHLRGAVGGQRP